MKNDETYRKDQKEAQEIWKNNNPDYWKNYRRDNKEYTDRNREQQHRRNQARKPKSAPVKQSAPIAKMDALTSGKTILSGKYELVPITSRVIAKMDALIVEIKTISGNCAYSGP